MSKPDGGPAFPVIGDGQSYGTVPGMTLRDYFAAKVASHFAINFYQGRPANEWARDAARTAYKIADAMLAERNKP